MTQQAADIQTINLRQHRQELPSQGELTQRGFSFEVG